MKVSNLFSFLWILTAPLFAHDSLVPRTSTALTLSVGSAMTLSQGPLAQLEQQCQTLANRSIEEVGFSRRQSDLLTQLERANGLLQESAANLARSNGISLTQVKAPSFASGKVIRDLPTLNAYLKANNVSATETNLANLQNGFHNAFGTGSRSVNASYSGSAYYSTPVNYSGYQPYSGSVGYSGSVYYDGTTSYYGSNRCNKGHSYSGYAGCRHAFSCDSGDHRYSGSLTCDNYVSSSGTTSYSGNKSYSGTQSYRGDVYYSGKVTASGSQPYSGTATGTCSDHHHQCACEGMANLTLALRAAFEERTLLQRQNQDLSNKISYLEQGIQSANQAQKLLKETTNKTSTFLNEANKERCALRSKETQMGVISTVVSALSASKKEEEKSILLMIKSQEERDRKEVEGLIGEYEKKIKFHSTLSQEKDFKLQEYQEANIRIMEESKKRQIEIREEMKNQCQKANEQELSYINSIGQLKIDLEQSNALMETTGNKSRGLLERLVKRVMVLSKKDKEVPTYLSSLRNKNLESFFDEIQDFLND